MTFVHTGPSAILQPDGRYLGFASGNRACAVSRETQEEAMADAAELEKSTS